MYEPLKSPADLQEPSHDIEDGRLPNGRVLGLGGERGVAGHQEVKVRGRDERRDQPDKIIIHVGRVSGNRFHKSGRFLILFLS